MRIHELHPTPGSHKPRTRVGRGISAGQGKTSGRGQKGAGARKGSKTPRGFEGGQLPLQQRLPYLRGFTNKWRREYAAVNLGKLNRFEKGSIVDGAALASAGLIAHPGDLVKVLGAGKVKVALTVRVHRASAAAKAALEAAGGTVELLDDREARLAARTKRIPGGARPTAAASSGGGAENDE